MLLLLRMNHIRLWMRKSKRDAVWTNEKISNKHDFESDTIATVDSNICQCPSNERTRELKRNLSQFFFCFVFICICKIPCRLSIPLSQSCRFQLASVLQYRKNEEFARFSISQCAFPGRNYQKEIPTRLEVKAFLIWKWQTFNLEMPTVKDYGFADNGTLVQQKNPHLH